MKGGTLSNVNLWENVLSRIVLFASGSAEREIDDTFKEDGRGSLR